MRSIFYLLCLNFCIIPYFSANIKVFYDVKFSQKFGADVANAIRRILAHAQHVLKWPTLTTKVILNAAYGIQPIPEVLEAGIST